jgi:ionotropic glutamate receptor
MMQLKMYDYKYHYHFTSLDLHTYDLRPLREHFVNLTAFRLIDPLQPAVQSVLEHMYRLQPLNTRSLSTSGLSALPYFHLQRSSSLESVPLSLSNASKASFDMTTRPSMLLQPALVYDAVHAFAHGLHSLLQDIQWASSTSTLTSSSSSSSSSASSSSRRAVTNGAIKNGKLEWFPLSVNNSVSGASCEHSHPWAGGLSLFNYVKAVEFNGLTGRVRFTRAGRRSTLRLQLLKLQDDRLESIGSWNSEPGTGLDVPDPNVFHDFGSRNITLRVTTIATIPYVTLRPGNHTGNARFEGFCIDLLDTIAANLGFQYELYLVPDGKFGAENTTTGEWNGLVREIIDKVCVL